jgi:hypothetical protein
MRAHHVYGPVEVTPPAYAYALKSTFRRIEVLTGTGLRLSGFSGRAAIIAGEGVKRRLVSIAILVAHPTKRNQAKYPPGAALRWSSPAGPPHQFAWMAILSRDPCHRLTRDAHGLASSRSLDQLAQTRLGGGKVDAKHFCCSSLFCRSTSNMVMALGQLPA